MGESLPAVITVILGCPQFAVLLEQSLEDLVTYVIAQPCVDVKDRAYPFVSYFEVLARFATGDDARALELVRREWGWMLDPARGGHGWSTGAAPALTAYVLGVRPTSPGYATFDVDPHRGDLGWAQGQVPTPHGPIRFAWSRAGARLVVPPGTVAHVHLGRFDRLVGAGTWIF